MVHRLACLIRRIHAAFIVHILHHRASIGHLIVLLLLHNIADATSTVLAGVRVETISTHIHAAAILIRTQYAFNASFAIVVFVQKLFNRCHIYVALFIYGW